MSGRAGMRTPGAPPPGLREQCAGQGVRVGATPRREPQKQLPATGALRLPGKGCGILDGTARRRGQAREAARKGLGAKRHQAKPRDPTEPGQGLLYRRGHSQRPASR